MNLDKKAMIAISSDLERLRSRAQSVVHDIEYFQMWDAHNPNSQRSYDNESMLYASLDKCLIELSSRLVVYADALDMPNLAKQVLIWQKRWSKEALRALDVWRSSDESGLYSPPLDELSPFIRALLHLARTENAELSELLTIESKERLRHCLESIPVMCRKLKMNPSSEKNVQDILDILLGAAFQDYTRRVQISKPLVNFKPDGGIESLNIAIECKFIDSEKELKTALRGIHEDISGYSGSKDWTEFWTLIYMTEPFETEKAFTAALDKSESAEAWKHVLVVGPGGRSQ